VLFRSGRGLPALGDLLHVLTDGTYVLYPDVPELAPTVELPSNHRYLGPVLWEPPAELSPEWPGGSGRPVVYVTLGSSGPSHLLADIVSQLGRLPVQLLVATAGRVRLGTVPSSVLVADFLPGSAAVERASAVVTNGGTSSGYQALSRGRPVLGVPWNLDQLLASQTIESAGAGSSVRASRRGVRELAHRVEAALAGEWAAGAERARAALARLDGRTRFLEFVRHAFGPIETRNSWN